MISKTRKWGLNMKKTNKEHVKSDNIEEYNEIVELLLQHEKREQLRNKDKEQLEDIIDSIFSRGEQW